MLHVIGEHLAVRAELDIAAEVDPVLEAHHETQPVVLHPEALLQNHRLERLLLEHCVFCFSLTEIALSIAVAEAHYHQSRVVQSPHHRLYRIASDGFGVEPNRVPAFPQKFFQLHCAGRLLVRVADENMANRWDWSFRPPVGTAFAAGMML